jgi:pseudouridine-5'-phosphate glycosidase
MEEQDQRQCSVQILDIPKTLEFLETQGVTVVSYQADAFPAFFTRSSGATSPRRIDSVHQCVSMACAESTRTAC